MMLSIAVPALAEDDAITPYGDFCQCGGRYGAMRNQWGRGPHEAHEAMLSMKEYYIQRGMEVREVKARGRFVVADILKEGNVVDRIVFDRRTGRIRSIY